jgi:hypothetical protein
MAEPTILDALLLALRFKNQSCELNDLPLGLGSKSKEQTIEFKTQNVVVIAVVHHGNPLIAA